MRALDCVVGEDCERSVPGGDPVASGHLETEFLSYAPSESAAREIVGALRLNDVKSKLDALIKAKRAEDRPWWDAMGSEGN